MISITILGNGNVAKNLFETFLSCDAVKMIQVVGRHLDRLNYFQGRVNLATYSDTLQPADIYLIAISDDAVQEISEALKVKGLVVHTSGAVPLNVLFKHTSSGVFYPLQTFSAGKQMNFSTIPMCIEAQNEKDEKLLYELASYISDTVVLIDSEKRKILHVSAVFANNFSNFMYILAADFCSKNKVDFTLLHSLIQETTNKIKVMSPVDAQTGPARRGDQKTLHSHLNALKNKDQREIYTLLSNAIKGRYSKKV